MCCEMMCSVVSDICCVDGECGNERRRRSVTCLCSAAAVSAS